MDSPDALLGLRTPKILDARLNGSTTGLNLGQRCQSRIDKY